MSSNRFFFCAIAVVIAATLLLQQLCLATATDARGPTRPRSAAAAAAASRGRSPSPSSRGGGGGGRARGLGSSAGQISPQELELAQYRVCPQMYCREVSSSCRLVEYVGMLQQTEVRGKIVTVECRGCEYCADVPSHYLSSRSIRSGLLDDQLQLDKETLPCSIVRCPVLPDTCIEVRLIDVIVAGQQCGQCPVCYDSDVVNVL